jgi:hypothetical protein
VATCFSNIFERMGKTEIGLLFPGKDLSPLLNSGLIFAIFKFEGNTPSKILKFIR